MNSSEAFKNRALSMYDFFYLARGEKTFKKTVRDARPYPSADGKFRPLLESVSRKTERNAFCFNANTSDVIFYYEWK